MNVIRDPNLYGPNARQGRGPIPEREKRDAPGTGIVRCVIAALALWSVAAAAIIAAGRGWLL